MSKTSKYLLMIGIYLFLSLLFLIGIECGLRAFGYGVDLDHLFLQTANGKYLYLNKTSVEGTLLNHKPQTEM